MGREQHVVWLIVVVVLLTLSSYTFVVNLHARPNPGPFFAIVSFSLLLVVIRVIRRIFAIRRGMYRAT